MGSHDYQHDINTQNSSDSIHAHHGLSIFSIEHIFSLVSHSSYGKRIKFLSHQLPDTKNLFYTRFIRKCIFESFKTIAKSYFLILNVSSKRIYLTNIIWCHFRRASNMVCKCNTRRIIYLKFVVFASIYFGYNVNRIYTP